MNRMGMLLGGLLCFLSATACTRAISLEYKPGVLTHKAVKSSSARIGVARFEDKRSWVEPGDRATQTYIASQGVWKFAMDYRGKAYIPINELIQELVVEEFQSSGLKATKLDNGKSFEKDSLLELGKAQQVDYVLSGQILSFEFANDTGFVTVTSRRVVTLTVDLTRVAGKSVFSQQAFSETNNENEGLGVMHSTNVDKLMNSVFKKVLAQLIVKVADQLAVDAETVALKVRIDGVEHWVPASAVL